MKRTCLTLIGFLMAASGIGSTQSSGGSILASTPAYSARRSFTGGNAVKI